MHVGLTVVETKKSVAHPRPRPAHGSTINRHPTTPVSPTPLDIPLGIPIQSKAVDRSDISHNFAGAPIGKSPRVSCK